MILTALHGHDFSSLARAFADFSQSLNEALPHAERFCRTATIREQRFAAAAGVGVSRLRRHNLGAVGGSALALPCEALGLSGSRGSAGPPAAAQRPARALLFSSE